MKSATLQVVSEEGCRVCILLLSAFALLHSSFVLLNYKISCHVAKIFQMKSATLQVVSEEGCRGCILLWVTLHCCILLFLPDATPCDSFFNRVSHAKPAEKEKPAPQRLTMWNEDYNRHCYILPFLPRQFARKCPVSHSFSEGRQVPRLTESRAVTPDLKHEKSSGSFLCRISWQRIRKYSFSLLQSYIVLISSRKKGVLIEG